MLVSVEFTVSGKNYKIERGRKPNIFKFFIDGVKKDEAQGENRNTQEEVNKVIGMSYEMFKQIAALSTYNQAFLFMRANDQRMIIEELLGITQLSQKAEILKKESRIIKQSIRDEEVRIKTISENNENIQKHISSLKNQSERFERKKESTVEELAQAIEDLEEIDIEKEIENHNKLEQYIKHKNEFEHHTKYLKDAEKRLENLNKRINKNQEELDKAKNKKCPTCGGNIHDNSFDKIVEDLEKNKKSLYIELEPLTEQYKIHKNWLDSSNDIDEKPETFYDKIHDAYHHRQNLNQLKSELLAEYEKENPFEAQIQNISENVIQTIDYTNLNELKKIAEHQDFLYKLLTSKESPLRKKIIEQNLSYLNQRLGYYLNKLGLPHTVEFKNDLSVEIILLGQDFDFGQLSRGQQNRLILSLSWAFRDVWETTGHPINIMFIDEMIDSGIDTLGVENTLSILKKMSRERQKDIFLISHKEELISRVHNVMMVIMENGFTQYQNDVEAQD